MTELRPPPPPVLVIGGDPAELADLCTRAGVAAVPFDKIDRSTVRLSYQMAGTLLVSRDDPLSDLFFALTAELAPPIVLATHKWTPELARELEQVGCAACVGWPVREEQIDALRAAFQRRQAVARYLPTLDLLLDPLSHSARVGSVWLQLSPQQFALLWCLSAHDGTPVPADALLREAWTSAPERSPRQALEYCVSQLRRKMRRARWNVSLETIRSFGYRLAHGGRSPAMSPEVNEH